MTVAIGLMVLTAADPEAVVVRNNIERARAGASLDIDYLAGLSADAVPTLVEAYPDLSPAGRAAVRAALCGSISTLPSPAALTLSRLRARDVATRICGSSRPT